MLISAGLDPLEIMSWNSSLRFGRMVLDERYCLSHRRRAFKATV